jgi:hypothetical protein
MKISEVALSDFWQNLYNGPVNLEARMNISPFLSVNYSCDEALQWTMKQLSQVGLRAVQTFDLHVARAGLHDCPCPHHGTNECDCQLVVVLVYGKAADPATLILHGNDGQTWLSTTDGPRQRSDAGLTNAIQQALEVRATEPNSS